MIVAGAERTVGQRMGRSDVSGGLGSTPVRTRYEGGATAWITETLAAPGT